ncbi:MAG: beta-glucosidase [Chloroflexi bacterium]|nr:beta-glucosidase [Chloroflexota bacterium]
MPPSRTFPDGFAWGAATASYQIEGAVDADGRGPSIWDVFSHTPGRIRDGSTGDVACDHYHRWAADLDLAAQLGLDAYRFSIAWPRVIPDGDGDVNVRGLDFYDRLVDGLLERGIRPVATLYHWDLPQALEDRGGWAERSAADAFARYAQAVVDRLGDRVPQWITLNEPWVSAFVGYASGRHAPGRTNLRDALLASHHLLLAHARVMPILRTTEARVGVTLNVSHVLPLTDSPADRDAAELADEQVNGWFADPILRGSYPDRMAAWYGSLLDGIVRHGDLEAIHAPIDFIGLNYYVRTHVRAVRGDASSSDPMDVLPYRAELPDGVPTTAMGWPVEPDGLRDFLIAFSASHPHVPILITENGSAWDDTVAADGSVDDPERTAYLESHLVAVHEAIAAGVDVRGYFAWSLLDNFEWAEGYAKRFGIVHVDYPTQRRTPKASARRYAEIVAANAV